MGATLDDFLLLLLEVDTADLERDGRGAGRG